MKRKGESVLLEVLGACRAVEEEGRDPFTVDVKGFLGGLAELLPRWRTTGQLIQDAEALAGLTRVVYRQSEQVAHEASALYIDPSLVADRVRRASVKALALAFIAAWRRMAVIDHLSQARLEEAVRYYLQLPPLKLRLQRVGPLPKAVPSLVNPEELVQLRILEEEEFGERLTRLREELKERTGGEGIGYEEFVYTADPTETALRAYLTSFLLTEEQASLEVDPIKGLMHLKSRPPSSGEPHSLAIPIDLKRAT